jgi:L-ascorbate metabolism protein UlaG (beta-lactamase superfamily)
LSIILKYKLYDILWTRFYQIEVGGKHILVDPFISANPLAENVDINTIKADYILLTHAHGDHILDVEAIAGAN